MRLSGWRGLAGLLLTVAFFLGCAVPPSGPEPPLTVAAAQQTLDSWNPNYCKVAEFYGLSPAESSRAERVAYVLLANPSDKGQKPAIYQAAFVLLSRANGRRQWFLTSLVTHGSGFLTRRQGWDNLMIPVQETPPVKK